MSIVSQNRDSVIRALGWDLTIPILTPHGHPIWDFNNRTKLAPMQAHSWLFVGALEKASYGPALGPTLYGC